MVPGDGAARRLSRRFDDAADDTQLHQVLRTQPEPVRGLPDLVGRAFEDRGRPFGRDDGGITVWRDP
ncbi:hypothetical protein GCM10018966_039430 [Streptomyces yanii]